MRVQFLLGEIFGGLRRNVSMIVSVVLVSMISMFFMGSGLLAQRQVDLAKGYWYDKVQVSVYLCTAQSTDTPSCSEGAVTDAQREQVRSSLQSLAPLVQEIHHESAAAAYQRFKQQFRNSPDLANVSPQAIPESFRVKLSDPERAPEIAEALDGAPGVEAVSDQREVLDTFFTLLRVLSIGAWALAAIMLLCSVLLIATTIRQVAFTRRRAVSIMRSVGATATVVHLPFLVESVVAVLIGSGLAVGLLWGLVHFGLGELATEGAGQTIAMIGASDVWAIAPWLVGGGLVLALVTAWLTLRRQVRV
ncbi:permease-like cell division protein FtsX [Dermacoccaceae bacterium W4C1]